MNILEIDVYCHSDSTIFQNEVPGTPIEAGKAYQVEEDELIPELDLREAVINKMDINPEYWRISQTAIVNGTPALIIDYDGTEFYVPYTKEEFRELLQNCGKDNGRSSDKNNTRLNEFYIGVGITQVLQALEKEFGETNNPAAVLVREMYDAQSKRIQNLQ